MDGKIFDGMFLYEITLLFLGIVLFLVMIVILIGKVYTRQSLNVLIPFFVLPVVMIGFPGISQANFMNGMLTLQTKTNLALEQPDNQELLDEISQEVANLSSRPIRRPENLMILGEAYEAVGKNNEAERVSEAVLQKQPDNADAQNLQLRLSLRENIEQVRENPEDTQAVREMKRNISALEASPERDTRDMLLLTRVHNTLGDASKAEIYADSVRKMNSRVDVGRFMEK
jgi:tetratricopeptide (TPR) repeat protein